jgi:hypothetical protein
LAKSLSLARSSAIAADDKTKEKDSGGRERTPLYMAESESAAHAGYKQHLVRLAENLLTAIEFQRAWLHDQLWLLAITIMFGIAVVTGYLRAGADESLRLRMALVHFGGGTAIWLVALYLLWWKRSSAWTRAGGWHLLGWLASWWFFCPLCMSLDYAFGERSALISGLATVGICIFYGILALVTAGHVRKLERERDLAFPALFNILPLIQAGGIAPTHEQKEQDSPASEPVAGNASPTRPSRVSRAEANVKAREYLEHHKRRESSAKPVSVRELAEAIGCSPGLAAKLEAWKAVQEQREKRNPTTKRKAAPLTEKVLGDAGQKERAEALHRLVDEQCADFEPSPLENDPPADPPLRVKARKEV